MLICMSCWEVYLDTLNKEEVLNENNEDIGYCLCPKKNCCGIVAYLDELIAPTIIELNNKGYKTNYSCSGHWYDDFIHIYISFENNVDFEVPEGFKWDEEENTLTLTENTLSDVSEKIEFISRANRKLYEWAVNLPGNNLINLITKIEDFDYNITHGELYNIEEFNKKSFTPNVGYIESVVVDGKVTNIIVSNWNKMQNTIKSPDDGEAVPFILGLDSLKDINGKVEVHWCYY